ncbi:hypothetical protein [Paenibacillus algorifonticola]|uniref:hypothetical protein n=1 Tax=Paenibacillus algorifonticola TaxID=684063 RepID=UPI00061943D5|nr:hypothetical protein [Paenibacillus algorifonticola]
MMEPNLDRFSRPLPSEREEQRPQDDSVRCHICGRDINRRFAEEWNGVEACRRCIREANEEAEQFDE